uniref:NAD(P)-binding domain-containing protein n=1 Tax=Spongospora subterranea TaxID=70186 RepID=A0A0H5QXM1_9EUKA|eukprot:CRZ06695.1 hypothetical protein [Spongospora subterranea]
MMPYRAIVLGGTGAVGRHVVSGLVKSQLCKDLTVIVRRQGDPQDLFGIASDKINVVVVDFDHLQQSSFDGFDVAFSCLGTTRAQAGSAAAFKKVDLDYTVESARLLKEAGTQQMLAVTAANANASSWFLYPQTKGLAEQKLAELNFQRLVILRPMMLVRDISARFVEKVGLALIPESFQVHVRQVADAMIKVAEQYQGAPQVGVPAVEFISHSDIRTM